MANPPDQDAFPPGDYPTSASFDLVAPHYDALMRGVPYGSWIQYLDELLKQYDLIPERVLDLACGTGSASAIMASRGWTVVGVDLAERMVAEAIRKAAKKGIPVSFHVQDAAELDLPGPPFDLCVSFFDSLNYIVDPERLDLAIQRVYAHLRPGGLLVFDINSAFALKHSFFDQENTNSRDRLRYVWRSFYDANTRLCTVRMRFFWRNPKGVDDEFREEHVQFAYEEDEVRRLLIQAGFEEIETFHAYTLLPVRPTSDRIFFVARKPATSAR
jgi:SAM-dependent methyltransferase